MSRILSILSVLMLLLAISKGLPYDYYIFLRWVICGSAGYIAYLSSEQKKGIFLVFFGLTALLFNPIIPFHLTKDLWVIIDAVVALGFFGSLFVIRVKGSNGL